MYEVVIAPARVTHYMARDYDRTGSVITLPQDAHNFIADDRRQVKSVIPGKLTTDRDTVLCLPYKITLVSGSYFLRNQNK